MTTGHKRMAVLTAKTEMISSLNVSNYERVGGRDLEYYLSSQIRSRSEQLFDELCAFSGTDSRDWSADLGRLFYGHRDTRSGRFHKIWLLVDAPIERHINH